MDHAYMIDDFIDMKRYVYGKFTGGNDKHYEDVEFDGIVRKFDLQACLMFRIWAPAGLESCGPSRIFINSRSKSPPDFGYGPWGEFQLVSESFVDIVERLDPGVHQFIRIPETYIKGGIRVNKTYYIMNVVRTVDALDVLNSNVRLEKRRDYSTSDIVYKSKYHINRPVKLSFYRNIICNINMWRGSSQDIDRLFFSKNLVSEVLSKKLSSLPYTVVDLV